MLAPGVTNLLERVAGLAAQNAAEAAAKKVAELAATPLRATVTGITSDNRIEIRRHTSINNDGTLGDPDPVPYQLISPGRKPQVGDEVHCLVWNGGVYVLGVEAKAGYIDALDANQAAQIAEGSAQVAQGSAQSANTNAEARYPKDGSQGATAAFFANMSRGTDRAFLRYDPSDGDDTMLGLNGGNDLYFKNISTAKTILRLHQEGHVEIPYDIDMFGNIQRPGGNVEILGNTNISGEISPSNNINPLGGIVHNSIANFVVNGNVNTTVTYNWGERVRIPVAYQDISGRFKPLPAGGNGVVMHDITLNAYKIANNETTAWGIEAYIWRP